MTMTLLSKICSFNFVTKEFYFNAEGVLNEARSGF